MLTKRAFEVLKMMADADAREEFEDSEIVCDRTSCWLGHQRIHRKTVDHLLTHVAISFVSEPGSLERYTISGTGREILKEPKTADRVLECLIKGIRCDAAGNPLAE